MDLTHLSSQLKLKTDFNAGSSLGLRDINSITGIVDNSASSIQALIFANDNPKYDDLDTTNFDVTGITSGYDNKAFVFDIKKEYKLGLSSDITDHYVEDNVAIQDHVALKPVILEVFGSIGEVNLKETENAEKENAKKQGLFNSVDSYISRMGSLTSFIPNLVNQALDIYNSAKYVYATVNKLVNTDVRDSSKKQDYTEKYDLDKIKQTKQFKWINWFKTQWEHRASFTIVTPYGVLSDMYIMELSSSQPENSRYLTNLSIKFKQIRKAKIIKSSQRTAQTMEAQKTKQKLTLEVPKTYFDIQKAFDEYPIQPVQPGGVTQVTEEEFESYKEIVRQSLNVDKFTGLYNNNQVTNNLGLFPQMQNYKTLQQTGAK